MTRPFDYFVVLAAKRTGSNLLEAGINQVPGLKCHGELFNPGFIGREGRTNYLGIDISARFRRPDRLLQAMLESDAETLHGFRLFAGHDERIVDEVLRNPRCAKIILRRRPLASYLSNLQAEETGQWLVTRKGSQKVVKVRFDPDGFEEYAAETEGWYRRLEERIREGGQTYFPIAYEEAKDTDMLNGIAGWLGVEGRLEKVEETTLRQNPVSLPERIENFDEFQRYLERSGYVEIVDRIPERDAFLLNGGSFWAARTGSALLFDVPATAPAILRNAYFKDAPYLIKGQPALAKWVHGVDQPMIAAYIAHPVQRAYDVFMRTMYRAPRNEAQGIHAWIEEEHELRIMTSREVEASPQPLEMAQHRQAFVAFLDFLDANLQGQTGIQKRRIWLPQCAFLSAAGRMLPGIRPVRQGFLARDLAAFPEVEAVADIVPEDEDFPLAPLYEKDIEQAVRRIYAQDYRFFGFQDWG